MLSKDISLPMNKKILQRLYINNGSSVAEIAKKIKCSSNSINYWMNKYGIPKRSISEAIYQKNNPKGDPFNFVKPNSLRKMFLFGLGLGLYWGEGTKKSLHSIRLSNTDPALVKSFIGCLISVYNIDKNKLRFQLLSYNDLDKDTLLHFWTKYLSVRSDQFSKTTILKRRGKGTYLQKMKYGVLLLTFSNVKLRNLICDQIANIKNL